MMNHINKPSLVALAVFLFASSEKSISNEADCTVVLSEQASELAAFYDKPITSITDYAIAVEDDTYETRDDVCFAINISVDGKELPADHPVIQTVDLASPKYNWQILLSYNSVQLSQPDYAKGLALTLWCNPDENHYFAYHQRLCHTKTAALSVGQPLPAPHLRTSGFTAEYFRNLTPVANKPVKNPIALGATVYYEIVRFDSPQAFYKMPILSQSTLVLLDFPDSSTENSLENTSQFLEFPAQNYARQLTELDSIKEIDHGIEERARRLQTFRQYMGSDMTAKLTEQDIKDNNKLFF